MHTPLKKRPNVDLRGVEAGLHRSFARVCVGVEWGVGHLTNGRITTTRYRSDLTRIDTDVQATAGLQKLNEQLADRHLSYDRIKAA